jgi:hypothetical protein
MGSVKCDIQRSDLPRTHVLTVSLYQLRRLCRLPYDINLGHILNMGQYRDQCHVDNP